MTKTLGLVGIVISATSLSAVASGQSQHQAPQCVPACRTGFTCVDGQCVAAQAPPAQPQAQPTPTADPAGAQAQPPYPPPPPTGQQAAGYGQPGAGYGEPPPPPAPAAGARTHDGFFLRFALGFGGFFDTLSFDNDFNGEVNVPLSGLAVVTELSIGGSPSPGFVIGGGIYNHIVPSMTADEIEVEGETSQLEEELEVEDSMATLYAPFIDVYPNPNGGFHIQGAIGYALLAPDEADFSDETFGGLGILAGAGYEGFVADEWSIGFIGRLMYASVSGDIDGVDVSHSLLAPSALFTVTYH